MTTAVALLVLDLASRDAAEAAARDAEALLPYIVDNVDPVQTGVNRDGEAWVSVSFDLAERHQEQAAFKLFTVLGDAHARDSYVAITVHGILQ